MEVFGHGFSRRRMNKFGGTRIPECEKCLAFKFTQSELSILRRSRYRSGTTWDDYLDTIKESDLSGKKVAIFGCGDSQSYADNFCDGIEDISLQWATLSLVGYVAWNVNHYRLQLRPKALKLSNLQTLNPEPANPEA